MNPSASLFAADNLGEGEHLVAGSAGNGPSHGLSCHTIHIESFGSPL